MYRGVWFWNTTKIGGSGGYDSPHSSKFIVGPTTGCGGGPPPNLEERAPRRCRVEILQGTEDAIVAWRSNLAVLARKFPDASVTLIPGARHQLLNEAPEYRDLAFARIRLALAAE